MKIFFGGALLLLAACAAKIPATTVIIVQQSPESCSIEAPIASTPISQVPTATVKEASLRSSGLTAAVYYLESGTSALPDFSKLQPQSTFPVTSINVSARESHLGFPGVDEREEWFGINYTGDFVVSEAGKYRFRLTADDGAELLIDGKKLISNDGIHPPATKEGEVFLSKGLHRIQVPYFQGPMYHIALVLEVAEPDKNFIIFDTDQPLGGKVRPEFGMLE
jgi:hypothetical protein